MLMLLGEIAEIKEELAKITSRISDIEIHQAVLKAELKTRPAPHQHSSTITSTMGTADVREQYTYIHTYIHQGFIQGGGGGGRGGNPTPSGNPPPPPLL